MYSASCVPSICLMQHLLFLKTVFERDNLIAGPNLILEPIHIDFRGGGSFVNVLKNVILVVCGH